MTVEERKLNLNTELRRIVGLIIKGYSPDKVILFGSLASGNIHEWSDIDLAIIKQTDKRFIDRLHEVHRITKPKVGVNFLVYTPSELQVMTEEGRYFLVEEIIKKGEVIYEKQ